MEERSEQFVHLADVGDLVSARVCVAVLGSEGINARVHGESLGPYPVTVGRMAVTQIWVPQSKIARARDILTEAEIDHVLSPEVRGGAIADREALPMKVVAAVVATILAAAVIQAAMRVF